jgi:hypothetical protein
MKGDSMFGRLKRRISPSAVIALIALIAALAGTAYAGSKISGKTIKKESLPGNRVKKDSLTGTQINEASLNGVGSANSLGSVTYATTTQPVPYSYDTPPPNNGTQFTANCPAGTKVIGGGAAAGNEADEFVNDSFPTSTRTGWTATIYNNQTPPVASDTVTVTAICTAVTASTG